MTRIPDCRVTANIIKFIELKKNKDAAFKKSIEVEKHRAHLVQSTKRP